MTYIQDEALARCRQEDLLRESLEHAKVKQIRVPKAKKDKLPTLRWWQNLWKRRTQTSNEHF